MKQRSIDAVWMHAIVVITGPEQGPQQFFVATCNRMTRPSREDATLLTFGAEYAPCPSLEEAEAKARQINRDKERVDWLMTMGCQTVAEAREQVRVEKFMGPLDVNRWMLAWREANKEKAQA